MFKVNNRNIWTTFEICSLRHWRRSFILIVNFEHILCASFIVCMLRKLAWPLMVKQVNGGWVKTRSPHIFKFFVVSIVIDFNLLVEHETANTKEYFNNSNSWFRLWEKNTQKYSKILGVILLFLENFPASAPVFFHEIYISIANTKQKERNINTKKWK